MTKDAPFIRRTLNQLGVPATVVPVDRDLLLGAVGVLAESRRKGKKTPLDSHFCTWAVNALRIDTLARHQSRDEPCHAKPEFTREKLGLGKSAVSEAMQYLVRQNRYTVVGRWRLPLPIMPAKREEIGKWPSGGEFKFVPLPEAALWLPGPDLVLLGCLADTAELARTSERTNMQPLSGELWSECFDQGFGRERLAATLRRLVEWDFLRRDGRTYFLTPNAAQTSYQRGRPEGEGSIRRLSREAGGCRFEIQTRRRHERDGAGAGSAAEGA